MLLRCRGVLQSGVGQGGAGRGGTVGGRVKCLVGLWVVQ